MVSLKTIESGGTSKEWPMRRRDGTGMDEPLVERSPAIETIRVLDHLRPADQLSGLRGSDDQASSTRGTGTPTSGGLS